jgi:asparagine synthetase B (glutamine-hydrolysing)
MREVSHRWVITFNGEIYNHVELRASWKLSGAILRPGAIPKSSSM